MKLTIVSIFVALCGVFSGAALAQAPANNNFANATNLTGFTGTVAGTTIGANRQSGEPLHLGNGSSATVWYNWTATVTGTVNFNTSSAVTNYDSMMAIYTGTAVNALTLVGSDDDSGAFSGTSSIDFEATAGTTYRIVVLGFGSGQGNFELNYTAPNPAGTLSFSPTEVLVNETEGTVTLTVARSGGTVGSVSVDYDTADDSALAGLDYTTTSGTLTFADGVSSRTFTVPITNDTEVETPKLFTVTLSAPTGGAVIGDSQASVTIISDEAPGVIEFDNTFVSVDEPSGPAKLTVRRTGGSSGTLTVDYTTVEGGSNPATVTADYTATSGTLTFGDGETSKMITVPVINDTEIESDAETFLVQLSNPSVPDALGGDSEAEVSIVSEDTIPGDNYAGAIEITGASGSIGGDDAGATAEGTYEIDIAGAVIWYRWTSPITGVVRFSVPEDFGHFVDLFRGTTYGNKVALVNGDFFTSTETAAVTAGTTYRIAVGGGASPFTLSWQTTTSGVLSVGGLQTYYDNNFGIELSRLLADEKGGNLNVTVRRTGGLEGTVSATYTVAADTDDSFAFTNATVDDDFTPVTGTVTFLAGEAEKTFAVAIVNDTELEDSIEDFVVTLSNPTGGALLGTAAVQVHLFDDEGDPANDDFVNAQPIFGVAGVVDADNGLADPELTDPLPFGMGHTVWYRWVPPASGVAQFIADPMGNPSDWVVQIYAANASGLQFIAGPTTEFDEFGDPITVQPRFEAVAGQTYFVRLDSSVGGTGPTTVQLSWTTATGGIIAFGNQTYTVKEGAGVQYDVVINRQGGLASGAAVTLVVSDDTAVAGDDYTGVNPTVVFAPGEASKTVSIPILNDADLEGDEGFSLSLQNASGGVLSPFSSDAYVTILDDEDDPANDAFSARQALGTSGSVNGTNEGAGVENGEPNHGLFSVWYGWTSPVGSPGVASFSLDATSSMVSPTVTVYTGTSLANLVKVAEGFDGASFLTTPNTAYIIAVTDAGGDDGSGFIAFSPSTFTLTFGFNAGGSILTLDSATVNVAENGGSAVISVTRSGSTAGTAIVQYETFDDLAISGEDYQHDLDTLTFAPGETTKNITINLINDGFVEGDESFLVSLTSPIGAVLAGGDGISARVNILDDDDDVLPPDNDNFAAAIELTGNDPVVSGFTEAATVEANEPTVAGQQPKASVWYKWTAPGNGAARFVLSPSTHYASVYTGATLAALTEVTFSAPRAFAVTSGTTYYVAVNAESGSAFDLTLNFTAAGVFSIDPASLAVNEATGPAALTVRRTDGTTGAVSVRLRTQGITATAGVDFTSVDTVVNFANGVSSQTVNVAITNDAFVEGGESVRLFLSDATGGAVIAYGPDEVVTLTIQDDEVAVPNDNFANALAISGPFGTTFGDNDGATAQPSEPNHDANGNGNSIWFRWTAPASGNVTFDTTGSGIATALAAYTGASVAALTVIDSDSDAGGESSVAFAATAGVNYFIAVDSTVGGAQGEVTLAWSLVAPGAFTFSPASYAATETSGNLVLTVTRAGGADGAATVDFATSNGTATAGQDYTTRTGTLSFANGEASRTITVPILNDSAVESPEEFTMTLSNPTGGATIATASATISLASDDVPSEFSFSPTTYSASEASANVVLTVTRTGGGVGTASVDYATVNGSAVAGQDFTQAAGTLNFGNGETSKTITVTLINDTGFELGESFTVTLSSPSSGATLGASNALVTLTSNDPFAPVATAFAALVNPGGSHGTSGILTLNEGTTGSFSGKLILGGKPLPVKGGFDAFGNAVVTVPRKNAFPVAVAIQVTDGGKSITGRVYDGTFESAFTGDASYYDGKVKLYPQPGTFTMALLPTETGANKPQGIGTASITVKPNGTFTIKGGQMADSTGLGASGFIAENGRVQFYALLYKGQGSLAGLVNFRSLVQTDADGTLAWLKPANLPKQKFFLNGVDTDLTLNASFYTKPAPNTRIDTAFDANSGATLIMLDNGNLAASLDITGTLDTRNKLTATAPVPLMFTGASKAGGFTGSFTPAGGAKTKFKGVFLQKSNQALGQFFGSSESGSVVVVPDTGM